MIIEREWTRFIGNCRIHYSRRSKKSRMGRFGGGWDWNVGVMAGGKTIIVNLLVASIRITPAKRCEFCGELIREVTVPMHKRLHDACKPGAEAMERMLA